MGNKKCKGQSQCNSCKYKSKCPVVTLTRKEANKLLCPLTPGGLPSNGLKSIESIINSRGLNFTIAYTSIMTRHHLENSSKRLAESQKLLEESKKKMQAYFEENTYVKNDKPIEVEKGQLDVFSANEISYSEMLSIAFDIRTLDKDARRITSALVQARKRGGNIERLKYHICWFNLPVKEGYINFIYSYVKK